MGDLSIFHTRVVAKPAQADAELVTKAQATQIAVQAAAQRVQVIDFSANPADLGLPPGTVVFRRPQA